jgi:Predicted transcriptional regulators
MHGSNYRFLPEHRRLAREFRVRFLDIVQQLLYNDTMETKTATTIFEVLSSEARLAIFRLLVKYAPDGLIAGDISRLLNIPKTNLSFHLKTIVHSGLVSMGREGRNTRYKADISLMLAAIDYLTAECCSGNSGQCGPVGRQVTLLVPCCTDQNRHEKRTS